MFSRFARWPSRRDPSGRGIAVFVLAAWAAAAPAPGFAAQGTTTPAKSASAPATGAAAPTKGAATSALSMPKIFYSGKPDAAAFRALCDGELTAAGIPHVFKLYQGGHNGTFWREHQDEWLAEAVNRLDPPEPNSP